MKIGPKCNIRPFCTQAKLTGVHEIKVKFEVPGKRKPILGGRFLIKKY